MKRITAKYVVRLTFCLLIFFNFSASRRVYTAIFVYHLCKRCTYLPKTSEGAIRRNLETKQ